MAVETGSADAHDIVPDSERRGVIGALPSPLRPYASLMRLDRPIGAWLLFWPGAWAVALAGLGPHGIALILWLALGAWAMRGAGCVWNDIVDRELDRRVERTRLRPLASGRVSLFGAFAILLSLGLVGLLVLLQLNAIAMMVALSSLLLVAAYPFMKRVTWWPQAWLGLVFSWAALVGWAQVRGEIVGVGPLDIAIALGLANPYPGVRAPFDISWAPLLLYAGSICWVIGYDTIYALQDREDDALVGVRSSALALGRHARAGIGAFYALALALWSLALWQERPDGLALVALLPMAIHLTYQVATLKPEDGEDALAKFRSNRFAGLLMFLACLVVGTS